MQQELQQMIREVREDGRTVFLSSHSLAEVERVADRVGILRHGHLGRGIGARIEQDPAAAARKQGHRDKTGRRAGGPSGFGGIRDRRRHVSRGCPPDG